MATDRHIEIAKHLQERALERLQAIDIDRLSPGSVAGRGRRTESFGIEKPGKGKAATHRP
jgi:hypothetical protein